MRVVAFIPARTGSKRLPHKNTACVGNTTLVQRTVNAACESGLAYKCVVSTDDEKILHNAGDAKYASHLFWHKRPPHTCTDHAQIESAIADFWRHEPKNERADVIVLLQPTSPFRTAAHVREALRLLEVTGADSVVGVTVGHEPHFAGRLKPRDWVGPTPVVSVADPVRYHPVEHGTFYDFHPFRDVTAERPRTQDMRPMGTENGSLYAFTREHWEKTGNRMGGHMVALPMSKIDGMDIDTAEDLAMANAMVAAGVAR